MDKAEAVERSKNYLKSIKEIISFERAYLFGSYARDQQRDDSDIDIGIMVKDLNEDYLSIMKKLYKQRRSIDVRIEPHLFIINKDKLEFFREIEKNGIELKI